MQPARDSGAVVGSSRRLQQHRSSRQGAAPSPTMKGNSSSTKMNMISPDKTEASTPPSSPEADNINISTSANHNNNSNKGGSADWGVAPDDEDNDDLQQQQRRNSLLEKPGNNVSNNNKSGLHEKFLSVDKILCRAPSHDSNISDLSASLSPHPAFASGNVGGGGNTNHRWGVEMLRRGKSMDSGNEIAEQHSRNKNTTVSGSDNIVLKVLNECGVLDNVNDLLRLTGNHNINSNNYAEEDEDEDIPPPPPQSSPPPPPPPTAAAQQSNKKSGGYCYEMPAVWGMAPDDNDIDDEDDDMKYVQGSSKTTKPQQAEEANEEEYDIVELVLDEAHLSGTSSSSTSSNKKVSTKNADAGATTATTASGVAPSSARTSATGGAAGGKSPVVLKGILKNKLSSIKMSSNKTSTTTTNDASPRPRPAVALLGTIGGMAVVDPSGRSSSNNDDGNSRSGNSPDGGVVVAAASSSFEPDQQQQLLGAFKYPETMNKPPRTPNKPTRTPLHSGSILTASQQEKLANVIKRSNSSGGSMNGNDPPGIVAENELTGADAATPLSPSSTPLRELDKVDLAMKAALTTSGSNDGDVEINDDLLVKNDVDEDEAELNDKKKKRGKTILGGFSFKSKSSPTSSSKKDPPTSSSSMNTEDDKSYNADAATTAASNTRSNSLKLRNKLKNEGLEAEADHIPSYATAVVDVNKNVMLTPQTIEEAKKWKAIYDSASKKHYYYHKVTREVKWDKPLGYDEARAGKVEATGDNTAAPRSATSKSTGFMGRGKNAGASANENKSTVNKDRSKKENKSGNINLSEEATYWRATLDITTNKTYYYNKKTKEVTWKKPACLDAANEEKNGGVGKKSNKNVVETAAMASVAEKRKKSWFKRGVSSSNIKDNDKNDSTQEKEEGAKASESSKKDGVSSENVDGATTDNSKYWRAALDASTGKTYYFNKKTQLVSWTKPEGFVEKDSSNNKKKEKEGSSENTTAVIPAVDTDAEKMEEIAITLEDVNQTAGSADADENQPSLPQPSTDDLSEMEGFTDAEAFDSHVEQTTRPAKEDAPFDEPFDCVPSSTKHARFEAKTQPKPVGLFSDPKQMKEEDDEEQDDIFVESDDVAAGDNLNRRVKSLKSAFSIDRQRTFASQTTETTRKAANLNTHLSSSRINRSMGTFEESLNNSSIASEIFFDDAEPVESQENRQSSGQDDRQVRPIKNYTVPLTSRIAQSIRNMSQHNEGNNRRYHGKRAENLGGDSSIESIEEGDEEDDRFMSVDDDVSALSGIGNESIGNTKNKRGLREVSNC
jgi:hypothetical protein